jgi:hypothetical protein
MTTTDKPVTRRTRRDYSVLYPSARDARPVVVTIKPGDILEFREHGRRGRWQLAIDTAFRYAVRLQALAASAEKHRLRNARRAKR